MANRDGYTAEDAAKVLEYLWWQYADDIEVTFYHVFKLCEEVSIDHDGDGGRLIQRFVNYPIRPCLQRWSGVETDRMPNKDWEHLNLLEPDRLVRLLWHDWLLKIESLYDDLRNTIGRSPLAESIHPDNIVLQDNLWWPLNVPMDFTSTLNGRTAVDMTGTKAVVGSAVPEIGQAKSPKDLKDLAARTRKMDLQQDGSSPLAAENLMQE